MKNNSPQFRWYQSDAEIRMLGDDSKSRVIGGYAAVYDSASVPMFGGQFTEVIRRGAFDGADMSRTVCVMNHNYDNLIATVSGGSLRVAPDDKGLFYEADVVPGAYGDALLELVKRGDLNKCSFAFYVRQDRWTENADGSTLRELLAIESVDDVGPVVRPAYEATSVALRSYYEACLNEHSSGKPRTRLNDDWQLLLAAMEE